MKKIILLLIIGLVVLGSIGCASVGTYAKDRGNDFLDMFKLTAAVGLGFHADVEATDLVHLGAGGSLMPMSGGFYGRELAGGLDCNLNLPPVTWLMPGLKESQEELRVPYYLITHCHVEGMDPHRTIETADSCACFISPLLTRRDIEKPFHRLFDIEAGGTAVLVGGRAGFSPGECLDFILGLFTIDFAKDDTKKKEAE